MRLARWQRVLHIEMGTLAVTEELHAKQQEAARAARTGVQKGFMAEREPAARSK